jgi:gas vesicle protein
VSNESQDGDDGLVSLLAGIGVGVLVGGLVALLMAPQAGTDTRTQLRGSVDDALGKLRESMDDLRAKVDEMSTSARDAMGKRDTGPSALQGGVAGATDDASAGGTG